MFCLVFFRQNTHTRIDSYYNGFLLGYLVPSPLARLCVCVGVLRRLTLSLSGLVGGDLLLLCYYSCGGVIVVTRELPSMYVPISNRGAHDSRMAGVHFEQATPYRGRAIRPSSQTLSLSYHTQPKGQGSEKKKKETMGETTHGHTQLLGTATKRSPRY